MVTRPIRMIEPRGLLDPLVAGVVAVLAVIDATLASHDRQAGERPVDAFAFALVIFASFSLIRRRQFESRRRHAGRAWAAGAPEHDTRGGLTRKTSSHSTIDASKAACRVAGTGFADYIDYITDRLQITRPQRSPNPSSATSWTPEIELEISAGVGRAAPFATVSENGTPITLISTISSASSKCRSSRSNHLRQR